MLAPDPKSSALDPLFARQYEAMRNAAWDRHRIRVQIHSGFRSRADQQRLFDLWRNGKGNRANPPGSSEHERGRAVDIAPDCNQAPILRQLLAEFGLFVTYGHEPWHLEPVWTRTATRDRWAARFPEHNQEDDDMAAEALQSNKALVDLMTEVVRRNVEDILHHDRVAMIGEIAKAVNELKMADAITDVAVEKIVYALLKPIAEKVGATLPPFSINPPEES